MTAGKINTHCVKFGRITALLLWLLMYAGTPSALAAEFDASPGFGGPDATDNTIAADRAPAVSVIERDLLQAWNNWKKELTEKTGIAFSLDYSAVGVSGDGATRDNASSGMARFYGSWDLVNRGGKNSGAFIWKIEHRYGYTEPPPSGFAIGELGYVGLQEPPFSNQRFRTTNLYWRQRFNEGRSTIVAGFLDATDYVDVYALASPWLHFFNFAFSTGSATIALPNDATLGLAGATMLGKNYYLIGGLTDANADPTDPFEGFDTFFDDNEYFKSIEFGWTTSHERLVLDNYHVTIWHKDRQDKLAVPSGQGVNVSFTRYLDQRWLPFVRAGWAEDAGTLLEKSLSVGIGYQPTPGGNLLGFGLNWGEPNETTFGSGLDDQITTELFYRINLGQNFAVTADLQYVKDPALNATEDSLWVFGLRGRLVL
jgi:porin